MVRVMEIARDELTLKILFPINFCLDNWHYLRYIENFSFEHIKNFFFQGDH